MNRASGSKDLLGSVAIVPDHSQNLLLCDKLYRLHTRESMVTPGFLTFALQSHPSRHQIMEMVSGAEGLANNIPQSDLKNLEIAVPPKNEQEKIAEHIRKEKELIRSSISRTKKSIDFLDEKRQGLITSATMERIDFTENQTEESETSS